jgi:heme/copper-type cytochrome/quinol oxidase subunit 2
MPIVVKVLPENEFMAWVNQAKNNYAVNEDIVVEEVEIVVSKNNLIEIEESSL